MDLRLNSGSGLQWALAALTGAVLYLAWPLWPALLLAAWTAALLRPWLLRFEKGLKGRTRAAAVLSLLLFLALLLPVGLVVLVALSGAEDLARAIATATSTKGVLEAIASDGVAAPPLQLPTSLPEGVALLERFGTQGLSVLTNLAGAAAKGLVAVLIYFGGSFVFLLDGPKIWTWIRQYSPLDANSMERFSKAFQETGRGLAVGVGLTSAAQGLAATLIYLLLGVPRWWVLGPMTGLTSMVPMVGSSLVWGPVAIGFFLNEHPIKATILMVFGVGVISSVDNLLRPVFARWGSLNMPMFLLFVAIFGGIAAFGIWGVLLGPLLVRLWMEALALRKEQGLLSGPAPRDPASAR